MVAKVQTLKASRGALATFPSLSVAMSGKTVLPLGTKVSAKNL